MTKGRSTGFAWRIRLVEHVDVAVPGREFFGAVGHANAAERGGERAFRRAGGSHRGKAPGRGTCLAPHCKPPPRRPANARPRTEAPPPENKRDDVVPGWNGNPRRRRRVGNNTIGVGRYHQGAQVVLPGRAGARQGEPGIREGAHPVRTSVLPGWSDPTITHRETMTRPT